MPNPRTAESERRGFTRCTVETELEYRQLGTAAAPPLRGRLVNLSGTGLMLEAQHGALPPGAEVEVMIPWPSRSRTVGLYLHAVGHVLRAEGNRVALAIEQSSFRRDNSGGEITSPQR